MKASIVDLRYHMNDVIKALDRNESVEVLYHNKKIGVIHSIKKQPISMDKVENHPFYGMAVNDKSSVTDVMKKLRGGRYDAL